MKKVVKIEKRVRFIRTQYAYVSVDTTPETEVPILKPQFSLDDKFVRELKRFNKLSSKEVRELSSMWLDFTDKQKKVALAGMRKM